MLGYITQFSDVNDKKGNDIIYLAYRFVEVYSMTDWKLLIELDRKLSLRTGLTDIKIKSLHKNLLEKRFSNISRDELEMVLKGYDRLSKIKIL